MRLPIALMLSGLLLTGLLACGAPEPQPQDEEEARELGRDTDETVFDDMIETQDRARGVQDLSLGRKSGVDSAIEDSEGAEREEP